MFGIDTLLFLVGPFVFPFVVGLKVRSKKRGLIPLLLIAAFFLTAGIILFVSTGTHGHTDATLEDFYAVWLIGMGIYLGFVFVMCWLLGRWVRNRERSAKNPARSNNVLPAQRNEQSMDNDGIPPSVGSVEDLNTLLSTSPRAEDGNASHAPVIA